MHTTMLSIPAGSGANEDAGGVLGQVAVVLDGAGVPARFRAGCRHSVAWFSHTLAARLLGRAQDPSLPLRAALAGAIEEVRSLHERECELDRGGPSATVVAVRCTPEAVEHLVLCDSSLLLERTGEGAGTAVTRLTDLRVDDVVREEGDAVAIEARRNAPGGFWVARHEPEAAAQALVGSMPRDSLRAVHLVSDGVTRTVDLLGMHDDSSLAAALREEPHALLDRLRRQESLLPVGQRPRKLHDDATVLTISLDDR
ncbi:protein phosphatase 2C domain-containing protein [Brachybacterium sp.]|uniref:protein phosphatase 2C domain-containing protein n=1 Tax=Brachybacterium sp. TaxID=1891286 RepID=UPI002ED10887